MELFIIICGIVLPTFFMLKSDISIDKSKKIPFANKFGTAVMWFTGLGSLYFIISIFFLKKIHPSKRIFLKIMFTIIICFICFYAGSALKYALTY